MPFPVVPTLRSGKYESTIVYNLFQIEQSTSKFDLFESVDSSVEVEIDVHSVRDKDTVVNVGKTLGIQLLELLEEGGAIRQVRVMITSMEALSAFLSLP